MSKEVLKEQDNTKDIASAFIAAHGTPALLTKLGKYKARRIGEIKSEELPAFLKELQDETPKSLGV